MVEYQLPKLTTRVRFPSLAPNHQRRLLWRPWLHMLFLVIVGLYGCAVVQETAAPVDQPPPVEEAVTGVYYRIQPGDSLWTIAQTYGVDLKVIAHSNDLTSTDRLLPGQELFIPQEGGAESRRPAPAAAAVTAPPESVPVSDRLFEWPLRGQLLRDFGSPSARYLNRGLSIMARAGDVVTAARPGKVIFADYLSGYAYTVIIDHGDGLTSVYARNSKILTTLGRVVAKGEDIALVGEPRRQPYLYFEIRRDGRAENPLHYLPKL